MVNPNRFYTYAYLRKDRTPYYIGKGSGKRIYDKKGRPCNKPKDKSRIIFLKQNLTEEEAFKHEIYMIDVLGRKDLGTGILHNKTDGGEGSSGVVKSVETLEKLSKNSEGRKWWNNSCGNNKFVEDCPGEGWVLGRKEETIKKLGKHLVGKKYWNDGCGNMVRSVECPGEGWVPGIKEETLKKKSEGRKGKRYWNDGCGNIVCSVECPGEGWFPGMGESRSESAKEIYKKNRENNVGLCGLTTEQRSEVSKRGGAKGGKNTNSQKWECTETGYVANPGNLSKYQKARGIDTSKRKRIA
jgi:hypothetical protein